MYRIYQYSDDLKTPFRHIELNRPMSIDYSDRAEPQPHDYRLEESLCRSRRLVRDIILCNDFKFFCTFTFDEKKVPDRYDYKSLQKSLSQFFANYKKRVQSDFIYLFIGERHEDGAVHFHGLTNLSVSSLVVPPNIWKRQNGKLTQVPNSPRYMDWPAFSSRFGYFSCSIIRDRARCSRYVTKYITKELANWGKGCQLVLRSKGLSVPQLVYEDDFSSLIIPANECDNIYCRSGWADGFHTYPYTRSWIYSGSVIKDMVQSEIFSNESGCVPCTYEQLSMM